MIKEAFIVPVLLLSSTILGYIVGIKLSPFLLRLQNKIRKKVKIKKYRIHHDLGGLILILISLFSPIFVVGVIFSGLGFGLFIEHLVTEGIKLISKSS